MRVSLSGPGVGVLQDVCLSIWTEDHSHDLMWKVTDVCDPKDCPTPLDIKVEPYKVTGSSMMAMMMLWCIVCMVLPLHIHSCNAGTAQKHWSHSAAGLLQSAGAAATLLVRSSIGHHQFDWYSY
jgi:hypothetical protein